MIEVFVDCLSYEQYENFLIELELFERIFIDPQFETEKKPEPR